MTDFATLGIRADTRDLPTARRELQQLTQQGATTERSITRSSGRMATSFRGVQSAAREMGRAMSDAFSMKNMIRDAARMATALAAAFSVRAVVQGISEFEQASSRMAAITRATEGELAKMRRTARELGATTEFSARQAAEGLTFLGMAGFSAAESVAAIPAVLDLATASAMDLGRAADVTSNIMSAFGVAAEDSAQVADLLAAASSRANTDVGQLGEAMKFVGPVASAMGISMSDAAAAVGALSDAGIQGGMAGTSLRGILSSLARPTRQATETMRALRIQMSEMNPETNSLVDIIDRLAASGLSAGQAMSIAGQRGGPALLALVEQRQSLRGLTDELRNVDGEASRMASTIRDNLGGDLQSFYSAIQNIIIALGDAGLTAVLRGSVQAATQLARTIGVVIDVVGGGARVIGMLARGIGGLAVDALRANVTLEQSLDNVTIAMGDEVRQIELLHAAMVDGEFQTLAVIRAKILEARAHRENIQALVDERKELELRAAGYTTLLREMELIREGMRAVRPESDQYEAMEQSLVGLLQQQQQILRSVQERLQVTEEEQAALNAIESTLEELENRHRVLNGEAREGSALTQRLQLGTTDWAIAMGGVRRETEGVLSVLQTLAGGVIDRASMTAQLEALRAGRGVAEARRAGIEMRENIELQGRVAQLQQRFGNRLGGMAGAALRVELEGRRELGRELEREYELRTEAERAAVSSGRSGASAAEREADSIRKVVEGLEDQIAMIGASSEARRLHQVLQSAGVELYSAEGMRIADLVEELTRLEEQQRAVDDANKQIESSFESAFVGFLTGTQSARQAIASLLQDLARLAAQSAFRSLMGAGGGGNILGSLIGMLGGGGIKKMDAGGHIPAGTVAEVAERRSEIVNGVLIPGPANVVGGAETARRMQGGGGQLSIGIGFDESINAFRATVRDETGQIVASGVQQSLTQYDRQLPQRMQQISRDPRRRG